MATSNPLRIVYDNAIDRSTLSASSTAGSLASSNLLTDNKSEVWRSTGTTARLTATWSVAELIACVAMPYCNLSSTATMRVRLTSEAQATNLLAYSEHFDNAVWNKTSITTAASSTVAPDGSTNAWTLTATAANAEIYQSVNVTAGKFVSSVFIRRKTGTGQVSIRNTANSTWMPLTLTSSWTRFSNDGGTSGTTAALDILIAVSGDVIEVWGGQLEAGSTATSYYPTTSASATRPLGYIDSWQSYTYDSGNVAANPVITPTVKGFTATSSASAYSYGGGTTARLWLSSAISTYGLAVDIVDTNNVQGYVESTRLVAGNYWTPTYNAGLNASVTFMDSTKNIRTDAGNLMSDVGTRYKKLSASLDLLLPTDRTNLWNIVKTVGIYSPVFISLYPQNSDSDLEQAHTVYGKFTSMSAIAARDYKIYSAPLEVEGV